jgi:hypothetical protein
VTVIIPNAKILSRWNGALEARLRQAPLEAFLRAHGQRWAVSGETRVTDNLACATIYLVNSALAHGGELPAAPLTLAQHSSVGQIACAVSSGLALLIQEPAQWRTAALVGTARILERHVGLSAAARAAAAAAREYHSAVSNGLQETGVLDIGHAARVAVEGNDEGALAGAVQLIRQRLATLPCASPAAMAQGLPALGYIPGTAALVSSTT